MDPMDQTSFYVFKKRSLDHRLIYGTHLRIIRALDHQDANRYLDQWNSEETKNMTSHQWDPVEIQTPWGSKSAYKLLFAGNTVFRAHLDIREAVLRAASDWDYCTEFPITLDFFLENGRSCGYIVHFEETRIGELREKIEKQIKDKETLDAYKEFLIERKSQQLPPSYGHNHNHIHIKNLDQNHNHNHNHNNHNPDHNHIHNHNYNPMHPRSLLQAFKRQRTEFLRLVRDNQSQYAQS
jgi:hypothetical protein